MTIRHLSIAFKTILLKEIRRFMRIWVQTVLPPVITTTLYFIIFGNLIGQRIGTMDGLAYIDFIVPGVIMMSIITSSYANVVSSFYGSKFQRYVEELLIAPIPYWLILIGFVAGGVARGMIVGLAVTAVAMLFTDIAFHHIGVTFTVALLTAVLFALGGFVNAVYANSFDDISIVPTFVLTPLTYLGGVFYSLTLLPEFWQQVSMANPILYMVNAFRYGMLGVSDIPIGMAFAIIGAFIVILYGYCLSLLKRGIGIRN